MTKTVLVIPFVVDETNRQRFLHREATLPALMPSAIYLGRLPDVDGLRVLEVQRRLTAVPASLKHEIDAYRPQSYGPIFDLEADVNYVVLNAGNEHELSIPFLLEKGWSEEPLPGWLLGLISKSWRDPNPEFVDM